MALQTSGTIKMSEINTELGRSSTATISLDTAENGGYATINTASTSYPSSGNPASMSEWYSYNHTASSSSSFTVYSTGFNEDSAACNLFYNDNLTLYYGSGSPACLTTNAYVYTDEAKSTPFDGGDLWYSSKSCGKAYYITEGGYVENLEDCTSVPYGLISESSTGGEASEACSFDLAYTAYKSGSNQAPSTGEYFYSNSARTTAYQPSDFDQWYAYQPNGSSTVYSVYLVDDGGECFIEGVQTC
jgi:hypothetical protein